MPIKLMTALYLFSLLSGVPSLAKAARFNGYPNISEDRAESTSFELRRLLCKSCGQVDDLVYVPARRAFFASTDSGDVWQINEQGLLVDVFRGLRWVRVSGVAFDDDHYIDWILTGDKAPKAYVSILDADALTAEVFNKKMDAAEQRVYKWRPGDGKSRYYLKTPQGWTMLKATRDYDTAYLRMYQGKQVIIYYPQEDNIDTGLSVVGLSNLADDNYAIRNTANPLFIEDFHKQGRSRFGFMDINSQGWEGIYGTGNFLINHANETLKFSAFHRITRGKRDRADIDIYQLPSDSHVPHVSVEPDLIFYGLYGRRRKQHNAAGEVGLYVLRPKLLLESSAMGGAKNHGVDRGRYQELNTAAVWRPVFEGFDPESAWLRNLRYINGREEDFNRDAKKQVVANNRPAPLAMDFVFTVSDAQFESFGYLHFNQSYYYFKSSTKTAYLDMVFDEQETLLALAQFSHEEDVALVTTAEWLDHGVSLAIALRSRNKTIMLEQAWLGEAEAEGEDGGELLKLHERDRIKQAFMRAQKSPKESVDYILLTTHLVTSNKNNTEFAYDMANYTTKLMIAGMKAGNIEFTEQLFLHYINVLYPRVGSDLKMQDVASMALVFGMTYNKEDVIAATFEKLLNGQAFDITTINNDVLLYNLACYYAVNNQQEELFKAAELAVKYGKKSTQFLADSDFSDYHKNIAFLNIIQGQP